MKRALHWKNEKGAVSFMTVMFFVLFLAVIAVSFVVMITNERQRALQNELSELALAAAESGVEDGKRIIIYCMNNQDEDSQRVCNEVELADDCDTLIERFGVSGQKIIGNPLSDAGGVEVGTNTVGSAEYAQEYTCLKINRYTNDVEYLLNSVDTKSNDVSASVIVPLDISGNEPVSHFVLQWHLFDEVPNGDGGSVSLRGNDENPQKVYWGNAPAMLRVEMVKTNDIGGLNIGNLIGATRAIYLRPSNSGHDGDNDNTDAINLLDNKYTPSVEANDIEYNPIERVKCRENGNGYACAAKLTYGGAMNPSDNYFIKITALYSDTHIKLSLPPNFQFNNLQPQIDVTGKVGNTLRRILTRVATNDAVAGEVFFPEYALETAAPVCKKMAIGQSSGEDLCSY